MQVPEAVYIYKKPDECSEDIGCLLLCPNRPLHVYFAVNLNVFINARVGLFPDTGIVELSFTSGTYRFCTATHKND